MAKDYSFTMNGHPNVYYKRLPRQLNVYFSEPDAGVNKDTGIVLFIPGFGANANSKVYKKMRSIFADQYNLVTVQCDYFGWEFMQTEVHKESMSNFNDMGIMQALDNISSVITIAEIIKDNGLTFNAGKIMIYGHSHGAYLSYLCNRFAPSLFSLIIDNSAWLYPAYLKSARQLYVDGKNVQFDYIAPAIIQDIEILKLPEIYKRVNNQCSVYSFHGMDDNLITIEDKRKFCDLLDKCYLKEITNKNIDQKIFRSSKHGLDADFLLLFEHVLNNTEIQFNAKDNISIDNQRIVTKKYSYYFDYTNGIPVMNFKSNR